MQYVPSYEKKNNFLRNMTNAILLRLEHRTS